MDLRIRSARDFRERHRRRRDRAPAYESVG